MDRFKFRGRRIDNGELVYGSLLRNEFGWNIVTFESVLVDPDTNSHDLEMILVGIVDGSQEQCTGLKDKNGKLIFEGDTLKFRHKSGAMDCDLLVIYDKESVQLSLKSITNEKTYWCPDFDSLLIRENGVEVIGNIHENPELLEHK